MKDDNYVLIKGWMINKLGLSGGALIVYAVVHGFSQDGQSCFCGSMSYLAGCSGMSERGVQNVLKKLIEKGCIKKMGKSPQGVNLYMAVDPDDINKPSPKKGGQTNGDDKGGSSAEKEEPKKEEPKQKEETDPRGRDIPAEPKKPTLFNREPENDLERVEKQWMFNYQEIFGELPVSPSWGAIRGRLKKVLKTTSLSQVLKALENARDDPWLVDNGYSLIKILAGDQLSKLLHAPARKKNREQENDWSNFGKKG